MVRIEAVYLGELRCEATHGPSGVRLVTDAPVDNQGRGEAFSPTDLLAAALGTCMVTIMGLYADQHGIPLEGTRVRIEKTMTRERPRRIARLDVALAMPPGIEEKARIALRICADGCPVRLSLHPDLEVAAVFEYPD
jgi:putative redox protein